MNVTAAGWRISPWEPDADAPLRREVRYWRHDELPETVAADVRVNGDGWEVRWRAWSPTHDDTVGNGNGRPNGAGAFDACKAEADAALDGFARRLAPRPCDCCDASPCRCVRCECACRCVTLVPPGGPEVCTLCRGGEHMEAR